jgi:beta-mannanase
MESSIVAFEHLIGHKLALDSIYTAWGEPMPVALSEWDLKAGRIPVISWGRVSSASVLAGQYDSQIRADARQLRSLRGPVLLRYFPEMNNHFLRKPAGRPAVYVAAWRKVYRMFRASGASNVQWVWCPSAIAFSSTTAQRFYPGRAYVNWICADGYNWAPTRPHSSWRSFAQIFTPFYQWAKDKSQPLLIGEVGTDEGKPGAKAHWLRQMAAELVTEFPRIRAIVYFDSRHQNFGLWFNWKINSSPSALDAFRVIARENYFSAHPTLGKTARNPR